VVKKCENLSGVPKQAEPSTCVFRRATLVRNVISGDKGGGSTHFRIPDAKKISHFFHLQGHYTMEVSALNI